MTAITVIPSLFMRGVANAGLRDFCSIDRDNGSGWEVLHSSTPCNIQHIDYRPVPIDPSDASTETGETVAVHLIRELSVRIGDRVHLLSAPLRKWVVGGGNITETLASFQILRALRPTAATPWTPIVIQRWSNSSQGPTELDEQISQFVLSTRVPIIVGESTYRGGVLFGPEGLPPLDIEIGDRFRYNEMTAYVTWVTPNPSERREATFYLDMPTPWKQ